MLFILLSILLTSYLVFTFKVFDRYNVNHFHAIVVNYIVCVITGCVMNGYVPDYASSASTDWFWVAVVLGCTYITMFNLMSLVTRRQGITVTNVATKLSMVIPVSMAVALYGEEMTALKICGVVLALPAVYLASLHPEPPHPDVKKSFLVFPLILFLGSGMADSLVKHAQQVYLDESEFNDFNVVIFSVAATAGVIGLLYDVIVRKNPLQKQAVLAGVLLGVPNYFSLYFLMKALGLPQLGATVIFPVNNIGIVSFSAVTAWLFFHEKLSVRNWIGLALAVAAILLMSFG